MAFIGGVFSLFFFIDFPVAYWYDSKTELQKECNHLSFCLN